MDFNLQSETDFETRVRWYAIVWQLQTIALLFSGAGALFWATATQFGRGPVEAILSVIMALFGVVWFLAAVGWLWAMTKGWHLVRDSMGGGDRITSWMLLFTLCPGMLFFSLASGDFAVFVVGTAVTGFLVLWEICWLLLTRNPSLPR